MSNESTILEPQSIPTEIKPNYANNFKTKFKKALDLLKPTILNVILTFTAFVIILATTKMLGIAILVGVCVYLLMSFAVQPLFKNKLGKSMKVISFKKESEKPELVPTKNNSIILYKQKRFLIALTLLQVEWFGNLIPLNPLWDLLLSEGVQIQDCREGCFLIIRKKIKINASKGLEDEANKLVKEIIRTIRLIRKKMEIEYEDINLRLVKGKEIIQNTLHLGLAPEKFVTLTEWSSDDYSFLSNDSLKISENMKEEPEQISDLGE
ncbi:MAG: hypothetical protein FK733_05105 [Asgard group archaeon]|nr:hypothetical protein [Asgard group archaeon]